LHKYNNNYNKPEDDFFDRNHNGVVLFYTGNEGDIVSFWENTGFLFDIAPLFSGLIVFCEHVSVTENYHKATLI
jgi:hypothetical protein